MAVLTDLPYIRGGGSKQDEVLLIIIRKAGTKNRPRNLYNFSLVCRVFYNVAARELFRDLVIQPKNIASIHNTLMCNKRLCRFVQSINITEENKEISKRKMQALHQGIWITEWKDDTEINDNNQLSGGCSTPVEQLTDCFENCCTLGNIQKIAVSCHFPFENHGAILPSGFVEKTIAAKQCCESLGTFSYFPPWVSRYTHEPLPLDPAYLLAFNSWANLTTLDLWALSFPPIKLWPGSSDAGPFFRLQKLTLHECVMDGPTLLKLTHSSTVKHKSLQAVDLRITRQPSGSSAEFQDCLDQFMIACSECPILKKLTFTLHHPEKLKSPLPSFPSLQTLELNGDSFESLPLSIPSIEEITLSYTINIPLRQISSLPRSTPLLSHVHIKTMDETSRNARNRWEFEPTAQFAQISQMHFHFLRSDVHPTANRVGTAADSGPLDGESADIDNVCHIPQKYWPSDRYGDTLITRDGFQFSIDGAHITCLNDLDLFSEDEEDEDEEEDVNQDPDALFQPSRRQLRRYERERIEDDRILRQAQMESESEADDDM